jgi:outer membrane lipopolysaccharide assembly protein LptE/RlpB
MAETTYKRFADPAHGIPHCGQVTGSTLCVGPTRSTPGRDGPTRSTPGSRGLVRGGPGICSRIQRRSGRSAFTSRSLISVVIATAALLLFSSCGYSPNPTLSSSIKRIYIPTFENDTAMYGIEQDLTQAVAEAFTSDNRLTVVSERDADVMLRGVIMKYEKGALTFDRAAAVGEYRVSISISVVLEDLKEGKVLWQDDTMNAWEAYNEDEEGATGEDEATARVMVTLANDIVSRTIEGW